MLAPGGKTIDFVLKRIYPVEKERLTTVDYGAARGRIKEPRVTF